MKKTNHTKALLKPYLIEGLSYNYVGSTDTCDPTANLNVAIKVAMKVGKVG